MYPLQQSVCFQLQADRAFAMNQAGSQLDVARRVDHASTYSCYVLDGGSVRQQQIGSYGSQSRRTESIGPGGVLKAIKTSINRKDLH